MNVFCDPIRSDRIPLLDNISASCVCGMQSPEVNDGRPETPMNTCCSSIRLLLFAMLCSLRTRKYGSGRSEVRITRTEKGSVVVVGPYESEAKKVHSLPAA